MRSPLADRPRLTRHVLAALAIILAAWSLLFAACWMISAGTAVAVELGFNAPTFLDAEHAQLLATVTPGSPAEQMGLRPGDRLVAIEGVPLEDADSQNRAWSRHKPGDLIAVTVIHAGEPSPTTLTGRFREASGNGSGVLADQLRFWFPVPFIVVGLAVLFVRVEDRDGWLLAILFAGFCGTQTSPNGFAAIAPWLRPLVLAYNAVFLGLVGPVCYWFFAVFPTRSPLDRRLPWFKWVIVVLALWMAVIGLDEGRLRLPGALAVALGDPTSESIPFWFELPLLVLGLSMLAVNFAYTPGGETRRKIRVIFWGTTVSLGPRLAVLATTRGFGLTAPGWLTTITAALVLLFPLSFAYAVVKHRVLEVPVLLRRSARYLLVQRGFAVSLSLVSIALTLLSASALSGRLQPVMDVTAPSGILLGAVFGTLVLWGGLHVHRRVSERIDRAFFRSAYDARVILEDLADQTRTARTREDLAALLERNLREALAPAWLSVCLAASDDRLVAVAGRALPDIARDAALLGELAADGRPRDIGDATAALSASALASAQPDCLVPIVGRNRSLSGLLVLGARRSEEPYSGEDKRLLAAVASQAAVALDNIRFAEELAERIERERRAAHEMEIAREVQTRLLPQAAPCLQTIDCGARCVQARSVGGDYYDFLDLGDRRVGFVLADVSGKGVHAALLSASLQAHVRSQAAVAPLDPVALLRRLNDIIWRSTAPQHYATLFLGIYDDGTRSLRYVNCGHNPPVLLRPDGAVERLDVTAPVIGLFEQWECRACGTELRCGDLLAVFSDGVTDALGDEEFGEARLLDCLRECRTGSAADAVASVLDAVQKFTTGEQTDDLTMLVARGI